MSNKYRILFEISNIGENSMLRAVNELEQIMNSNTGIHAGFDMQVDQIMINEIDEEEETK